MTDTVIYCDGACEPINPGGIATYGWVAYYKGKRARWDKGVICEGDGATNNVAEYTALIKALEYMSSKDFWGPLRICSDSQLLIMQMSGNWRVKSPNIRPLYQRAQELARDFEIEYQWVPREENEYADRLSKQAYYEHRKNKNGRAT